MSLSADDVAAATHSAQAVLRERGHEDFVCVLVVEDIDHTQVGSYPPGMREAWMALSNGRDAIEYAIASEAELN